MLNIGDKVTVIVDVNIGYAKGYRGTITAVRDDLCDVVVYEIDGNYEYSEDELELTVDSMKFKVGDEVRVIKGEYMGVSGIIMIVEDDDGLPYCIQGDLWFADDELELALASKGLLKTEFQNEIPKCNPKSNLEPSDYFKDSFEYGAIPMLNSEIIGLKATIASLESELLNVYRELYRINKDSQN